MITPALISLPFLHLASDVGLRDAHFRLLVTLEALGAACPGGYEDAGELSHLCGRGDASFSDIVADLVRWDVISYQDGPKGRRRYWLAYPLANIQGLQPLLVPTMNSNGRQPPRGSGLSRFSRTR